MPGLVNVMNDRLLDYSKRQLLLEGKRMINMKNEKT